MSGFEYPRHSPDRDEENTRYLLLCLCDCEFSRYLFRMFEYASLSVAAEFQSREDPGPESDGGALMAHSFHDQAQVNDSLRRVKAAGKVLRIVPESHQPLQPPK